MFQLWNHGRTHKYTCQELYKCKFSLSRYDITDFVTRMVEEEIIVGGNGSQQVFLKPGPKNPS